MAALEDDAVVGSAEGLIGDRGTRTTDHRTPTPVNSHTQTPQQALQWKALVVDKAEGLVVVTIKGVV